MAGSGIRGETVSEILWIEQAEDPTDTGMSRLVNGQFKFKDASGIFNPRDGASLLGRAIFRVGGGVVYTNDGDIAIKVDA